MFTNKCILVLRVQNKANLCQLLEFDLRKMVFKNLVESLKQLNKRENKTKSAISPKR